MTTSRSMPMSDRETWEKKLALLLKKKEVTRDMLERLRQQGQACSEELFGIEAQITMAREHLDGILVREANGNGAEKVVT